jgi:hypothetical protein
MNGKRQWRIILWRIRYVLALAEWQHVAGFGLLSFWVLTLCVVDYPLYRETQALSSRLTASRTARATRPKPASSPDQEPRNLAAGFVASLPAYETYPKQLNTLTDLAGKNGVAVIRIDYRYESLPELPIRKLMLHLDLSGNETQLRELLRTLLNTFPNLSVARLAYTKAADPGATMEQRLDINLYYRSDKAAA